MKRSVLTIFCLALLFSQSLGARVIYGVDNRIEVSEGSAFERHLAKSAAVMISSQSLNYTSDKQVFFEALTLNDFLEMTEGKRACEGERFIDQKVPSECSGFLIGPDLIVTAGHCTAVPDFCSDFKWVFDFKTDPSKGAEILVRADDVYSCKKVVSELLDMNYGLDYALVRLDRKVQDRAPLKINGSQKIQDEATLMVIGSPSGLPLKIATGAQVRDNTHPFYFSANLDTFQGSSGSAVFNAETGIVEGIIVRGENDYVTNTELMCTEVNRCSDEGCRGEEVTRLTAIPEVALQNTLNQAAFRGDLETLSHLLELKTWIDFYTDDGQSALIKAVQGGQAEAVELLIEHGADVNLQDSEGNSALHHLSRLQNQEAIFKILVSAGADLSLKNNAGQEARELILD